MKNLESLFKVFKQIAYLVPSYMRRKSIMVFLSMIVSSLLELLGVSIIVPFLQLLTSPESIKSEWYISWLFRINPEVSNRFLLIFVSGSFVFVYLVKNGFLIFAAYIQSVFSATYMQDASERMLFSFLKRPYEFFTNSNSSILLRGINADISAVYYSLLSIFTLLGECLTIICIGAFLVITDWIVAVTAIIVATVCMLLIVFGFKNKIKSASGEFREANAEKYKYSLQAIHGIKEISVLDRKDVFINTYGEAAKKEKNAIITKEFLAACPDRIIEGFCISGFIVIVCIRILMGGDISKFITILGTFAMGAFKILPSFSKISSRINSIVFYVPSIQSCYDIFKEAEKIDKENIESDKNSTIFLEQRKQISFSDSIEFKGVSWKYLNSERYLFSDISLSIKKGQSIAFIGSSGAGKSTLADILLGLYKPQKGLITVDGVSIYDIPHDWCKMIGYVPQNVYLIDDSISKNVAFGLPDELIDYERVWNALEQAQMKSFVENLPNGLDTVVGERGVKVSGGQRQRIAIARALYEDPDVLVFDEATSALDSETENSVMEAIEALQGIKTLVIVAHRISTIKNCDVIYRIEDGVIVTVDKEELFESIM